MRLILIPSTSAILLFTGSKAAAFTTHYFKSFMKKILLILLTFRLCTGFAQSQCNMQSLCLPTILQRLFTKRPRGTPSLRQLRWQQLEVVGFLHFTVNTFTDKEWGLGNESEQIFNPTELDAGQWIRTCKAAGIKQVILTAKHHDGFCLWPFQIHRPFGKKQSVERGQR